MDSAAVADRVCRKMRKVMKVLEKEYPDDIFQVDLMFFIGAIIDRWDIPDAEVEKIMNGAVAVRDRHQGQRR